MAEIIMSQLLAGAFHVGKWTSCHVIPSPIGLDGAEIVVVAAQLRLQAVVRAIDWR